MGKTIKRARFFFTRISLPAVSSTTSALFHLQQEEAGFHDRTSRRQCKLCRQRKYLPTNGKRRESYCQLSLPQLAHVFRRIIICKRRRRQGPMTEPVGRSGQQKNSVLLQTVYQNIVQSIPSQYTGRITICRRRRGSMTEPFGGSANCVDSANRGGQRTGKGQFQAHTSFNLFLLHLQMG